MLVGFHGSIKVVPLVIVMAPPRAVLCETLVRQSLILCHALPPCNIDYIFVYALCCCVVFSKRKQFSLSRLGDTYVQFFTVKYVYLEPYCITHNRFLFLSSSSAPHLDSPLSVLTKVILNKSANIVQLNDSINSNPSNQPIRLLVVGWFWT